ncbi:MAG: nicotinate-nucleotide adenylyltransferase [Candidatus Hydrogenedentes bacterium]|nr:nicotinate-nucleotide adenylyltransferase [Candidatus Hydrogenedentota bacterium]
MDKLDSNKISIGLCGGTFDPVHIMHLELAEAAYNYAKLDKVIFVPAGIPPHKHTVCAQPIHRYNMLALALKGKDYFELSKYEIENCEPSYTVNTIKHFREIYPSASIGLILGYDTFLDVVNWYHAEEVIEMVDKFLVASRTLSNNENKKISPILLNKTIFLPFQPRDISSHEIRALIKNGKAITGLVPPEVERYIYENGLYRD